MSILKGLHFADAHTGLDDSGPIDRQTGLSARLTDYLDSLDRIAKYVETQDINVVIFSGDAFHVCRPTPTFEREFAQRINRMASSAPVVVIVGNHDMPGAFGKAHPLAIYTALHVPEVHVVDRPQLLHLETTAGSVQVVGIPWPSRHNVMTSEKVAGLPKEEVNRLIGAAVAESIQKLARDLDPNLPSILAAHLSVEGGDMGGGTPVGLGAEISLPLEAVALPQFDYVALGHLHKYQSLNDSPPVVYAGSIERGDFGEEHEEKGFVVVELGNGDEDDLLEGAFTSVEFVPLPARKFVTIQVSLDGTDPTQAVLQAIGERQIEDAIVRVIIEGTAEQAALLDETQVQRALKPALRQAVNKRIERETRTRLEGMSYQEMSPMDLLQAYLSSNGRSPQEQEALMAAAEELMTEVAA